MTKKRSLAGDQRAQATQTTVGWLVVAVAIFVSLVVLKPSLPNKLVLLTGPQGGSYHELGTRYAALLRDRGLQTDVVVTDGGLDNLDRLRDGQKATIGFVPSNLENATRSPMDVAHLVSLGSVGFEPIWLFYRSNLDVDDVGDLALLTVGTGDDDTVVGWLARRLLEINGVHDTVDFVGEPSDENGSAVDALLDGSVDAVFAMGGPTAPSIQRFFRADGISMLSFRRADAYVARTPGLTKLVAPEGVFDLARNIPPEDAKLLAATTNLVGDDSLPPPLVSLLLGAARSMHEHRGLLAGNVTFPNPEGVSLPLDTAAARFYDQGETGLATHVPYAVARHLRHFGGVVLPLVGLAIILVKLLPVALKSWTAFRLAGFFKRLEAVEKADFAGAEPAELLASLQEIDADSAKLLVPRSKIADYIDFRQFLHDMRDRINTGQERKIKAELLGSKDDG